ncbi:MAG: hypothetical protein COB22_08090 [Cycloclasticus sp.]|nr:MAG: hypothetical protein COB22_08090 [Cycloclasticus sp.]
MNIKREHVYFGSNPYSKAPIIMYSVTVDESELAVAKNVCFQMSEVFSQCYIDAKPEEGATEMYVGSVLSNIVKFLINDNNGCITSSGVSSTADSNGVLIWVDFHYLRISTLAMKSVLSIFQLLMTGKAMQCDEVQRTLKFFQASCQKAHPRKTPFFDIAQEDKIPMSPYPSIFNAWQFGWGKKSRVFVSASPMEDSYHGVRTSLDKAISLRMLRDIGVPTAKSVVINKKEELKRAGETIGYPCVVKPIRGTQGKGVTANIQNYNELQLAYDHAKGSLYGKNPLLIEAFVEGDVYRIMIADGEMIGAILRKPSYVVGNGRSTLKELIYKLNKQREALNTAPAQLMPVKIDAALMVHLKKSGVSLDDVINNSETVTLNSVAAHSSGAIVDNVTNLLHPDNIVMFQLIAQASSIANLGIDYITKNISKPFNETKGVVIEYNHHPSLSAAVFSSNPKDAVRSILNVGSGRIPAVFLVLDAESMRQAESFFIQNIKDSSIGWVCADKAYIGQVLLSIGDATGWMPVKILLRNKTVQKVVLVCTDVDMMEKGLPVDKADLICMHNVNLTEPWGSVITNASPVVKTYTDLNALFSFVLNHLEARHNS